MKTRTSRRVLAVTTPVVVVADLSTKVWASHGWWPTFNLADVSLNIGIGLLLLTSFGDGRSNGNATEVQDATSTGRPT